MVGHADGVDVYMAMRSAWSRRIPKVLEKADPDLLLRLIDLADASDGITQKALQRALHINQARLSKLKDKLVKEKWMEVWRPKDRRKLLMKTTPRAKGIVADLGRWLSELALLHKPRPTVKARLAMDALEGKLAAAMKTASGSRKRSPAAPGPMHPEDRETIFELMARTSQSD